jgi:hypothetical protein
LCRAPRATLLIESSLVDRLIDRCGAAPVEPLAAVPGRGGRRGKAGAARAQPAKGARGLIAARKDILELTAGDPAMEIDVDRWEDLRLFHGIRST